MARVLRTKELNKNKQNKLTWSKNWSQPSSPSCNQAYLVNFVMELMSGGELFDHIIETVPTAPAPPPSNASFVCCMLDWNNKRRKIRGRWTENQTPSVSRPGAASLQSREKIVAKDRDYIHYFALSAGDVDSRRWQRSFLGCPPSPQASWSPLPKRGVLLHPVAAAPPQRSATPGGPPHHLAARTKAARTKDANKTNNQATVGLSILRCNLAEEADRRLTWLHDQTGVH